MAKKRAVKAPLKVEEENLPVGHINLAIYMDGTYDLDTKINPAFIALYANVMADMSENKINTTLIERFASDEDPVNQEIAIFLTNWLKALKTYNKPLIAPDKVFRKNKK